MSGRYDGRTAFVTGAQGFIGSWLSERLLDNVPMQELLLHAKEEILSTTRLPMAIDFLLTELKHTGMMSTAMERLSHYFTRFQTYVMREAEAERGRFDLRIAIAILPGPPPRSSTPTSGR